jgi:hypothetical protein
MVQHLKSIEVAGKNSDFFRTPFTEGTEIDRSQLKHCSAFGLQQGATRFQVWTRRPELPKHGFAKFIDPEFRVQNQVCRRLRKRRYAAKPNGEKESMNAHPWAPRTQQLRYVVHKRIDLAATRHNCALTCGI